MLRPAAFVASGLLALSVSACGGGSGASGAPTDASAGDFCKAYVSIFSADMANITGKDIKDWGNKLADTGTPKDISDDERAGFEIFVKFAKGVDANASIDDIEDPKVSKDEQKQVDAFIAYTAKNCTDEMTKAMLPSDFPSQ